MAWTCGIRVEPPTRRISAISLRLELGVLDGLAARLFEPLEDGLDQRFELAPRDGDLQVLRARGVGRDERQVDGRFDLRAELALGLFGRLFEPLVGHRVLSQVDALGLLELVGQVVDQDGVQIVATEVRVAVGAEHLEDVVADVQDGDIEGAAAEIEDGDLFVLLLLEAIGQGGGGRLVDDSLDLEARDLAGVFGRLTLGIVEVGRDRDDGLVDLLAEVVFGRLLEVLEDHGRDFRRGVFLASHVDLDQFAGPARDAVRDDLLFGSDLIVPSTHKPLDREHRIFWIGDLLVLGDLPDQPLAFVREANHRRRQSRTGGIHQYLRRRTFHHRHHRVRRAQVYSDNLSHLKRPFLGTESH